MEYVKCNNCKGTGLVPTGHGPKRWEKCPICKGRGKKQVTDYKKQGGKTHEYRS